MKSKVLLSLMAFGISAAVGCSAILETASKEGARERCKQYKRDAEIVENDGQKNKLITLLNECISQASEGNVGLVDIARADKEFYRAIEDKAVTNDELESLRRELGLEAAK